MPKFPYKWPPVTQLVAVVCIVGFMAVLLFPVFQRRVDGGNRHSSCQSALKQLGLAYLQYEQDAGSVLPSGVNTSGNGWAGQLYPYTKSVSVYHCPEDAHDGAFVSYAENRNIAGLNISKLANSATTVAAYEFTTLSCDPSTPETVSATGTSAPQDSTRHTSDFALNFLMADGSVKWLLPAQVSSGSSAARPKILPSVRIIRTFAVK